MDYIQSMEFSRLEYWSRQPFPSPGDLPNPGIKPWSPALREDSLSAEPQGKSLSDTKSRALELAEGMRDRIFWVNQAASWPSPHGTLSSPATDKLVAIHLSSSSFPYSDAIVLLLFALSLWVHALKREETPVLPFSGHKSWVCVFNPPSLTGIPSAF